MLINWKWHLVLFSAGELLFLFSFDCDGYIFDTRLDKKEVLNQSDRISIQLSSHSSKRVTQPFLFVELSSIQLLLASNWLNPTIISNWKLLSRALDQVQLHTLMVNQLILLTLIKHWFKVPEPENLFEFNDVKTGLISIFEDFNFLWP